MTRTVAVLSAVFLLFLGYTAWVVATADPGLVSYLRALRPDSWGAQILADLTVALALVCTWLVRDARRRGRVAWPWVLATVVFGSLSPLAYLLAREWDPRRSPRAPEAAARLP